MSLRLETVGRYLASWLVTEPTVPAESDINLIIDTNLVLYVGLIIDGVLRIENRLLTKIFQRKRKEVTGEWRKLYIEDLHNF
jgi:hypothetical protein